MEAQAKTPAYWREYAQKRCVAWNWNVNVAEIANELIREEIDNESEAFTIIGEEFVKFFGTHDKTAPMFWEIIGQIVEEFG
jgi:hypothetical protein